MKKSLLKLSLIALVAVSASCKSESKNEANEAAEVASATEEAVKFTAVAGESTIEWTGSKPTGSHTGTIAIKEGALMLNESRIESGSFTIDMNTITVTDLEAGHGKENLESHLKGNAEGKEDHFFNVAEFPTASFEVTGIKEVEAKTFLEGNLTIKGITKNVTFPVSVSNQEGTLTITSEPFTIDRTQWNVNYGSKSIFDDLGDKFINDDIELTVNIKAAKA